MVLLAGWEAKSAQDGTSNATGEVNNVTRSSALGKFRLARLSEYDMDKCSNSPGLILSAELSSESTSVPLAFRHRLKCGLGWGAHGNQRHGCRAYHLVCGLGFP